MCSHSTMNTLHHDSSIQRAGAHLAQQAPGAQCGSSPSRHDGLKQRTALAPGPEQVLGADSQCSTANPDALNAVTVCLSTAITWSGAQQYPQHVASVFNSKGGVH